MTIYCTYLTVYYGNKLPTFYIGSTTENKINSGYRGTVTSKKYKQIWKKELKENPHLFKTFIVSKHKTRKECLEKELFFQKKLSVVKSELYINLSYAQPNGYFGMNTTGIPKSNSMREKMIGNRNAMGNHKPKTKQHRERISKALTGKIRSKEWSEAISKGKRGGHWWSDDNGNTKMSHQCPGPEWFRGRHSS